MDSPLLDLDDVSDFMPSVNPLMTENNPMLSQSCLGSENLKSRQGSTLNTPPRPQTSPLSSGDQIIQTNLGLGGEFFSDECSIGFTANQPLTAANNQDFTDQLAEAESNEQLLLGEVDSEELKALDEAFDEEFVRSALEETDRENTFEESNPNQAHDSSNTFEDESQADLEVEGITSDMDLRIKGERNLVVPDVYIIPDAADAKTVAALGLIGLSSPPTTFHSLPEPSLPESGSESQDSIPPSQVGKAKRLKSTDTSPSNNGGANSSKSNGRSRRNREKKEFLHQKDDPSDPIAQRARYAKSYRERKKHEHDKEVHSLKAIIAERDALIEKLSTENIKMSTELHKVSLTRDLTIKFSQNIAAVVKSMSTISPGVDIRLTPALGDLNSPKLSEGECADIARESLNSQRFTLTFDYNDSEKKLVTHGVPPKKDNST